MSKELMEQLEAIAKAEKLAGGDLEAVKTALKALSGIEKGKIPQAVLSMLASAAGISQKAAKSADDPKDDGKPGIEEILNSVDAKVKPQLEAILKSNEAQAKELEAIKKSQAEALAEAKQREYVAKAENFKTLPIAPEPLGAIMLAVSAMGEEPVKAFDEFLTKTSEIIQKSEVLAELGTSARGGVKGLEAIEKKAEEMIKSADGKLTKEQAVSAIINADPALYDAYMAERDGGAA